MKPHHSKQNSLQFKPTSSLNNDTYLQRTQVIAKTYRKKTHPNDSNPVAFLYSTPSALNRYPPVRQAKKSVGKNGENRSNQKKSQPRLQNEKSIERLRTVYKPNQTNVLGVKAKITKIVNLLSIKPSGDTKEMLTQVYQASESVQNLLKEWRRLDIYDEIDELLSKIVSTYTLLIQDVAFKGYTFASECIAKYQADLSKLQLQNDALKSLMQFQTNKFEVQMMQVENRIYEEYEKNQWGTFIFHELATKCFDLEHFISGSDVYRKAKKQYLQARSVPRNPSKKAKQGGQGEADKGKSGQRMTRSVLVDEKGKLEGESPSKLKNCSQFS